MLGLELSQLAGVDGGRRRGGVVLPSTLRRPSRLEGERDTLAEIFEPPSRIHQPDPQTPLPDTRILPPDPQTPLPDTRPPQRPTTI